MASRWRTLRFSLSKYFDYVGDTYVKLIYQNQTMSALLVHLWKCYHQFLWISINQSNFTTWWRMKYLGDIVFNPQTIKQELFTLFALCSPYFTNILR